jgi:hypothetical protein
MAVAPSTTAPSLSAAQAGATSAHGLRVAHAPSGLVIGGLDKETLAALLRRMS